MSMITRACKSAAMVLSVGAFQAYPAVAQEVWFAPVHETPISPMQSKGPPDYWQMLSSTDGWQDAARHVRVFKIYRDVLNIGPRNEAHLRQAFAFLRQHHISLALELAVLTLGPNNCGHTVEGYDQPDAPLRLATRIRALGGELSFMAFDEPRWYSEFDTNPRRCTFSAEQAAADAARAVNEVSSVFPAVQYGDIEPIKDQNAEQILRSYGEWIAALTRSVGRPPAFFHADVIWRETSMNTLSALGQEVKRNRVKFGVIYNADAGISDNVDWVESATRHFCEYESGPYVRADHAVIQSWVKYPTKVLPENAPGTYTNLIMNVVTRSCR